MTREEKLISMKMMDLVEVAQKLNIKIDVKGSKSKAVAKILAAENAQNEVKNPDEISTDEYVAEVMKQKKELGIECPPIESYEVVDTEKELTDEQYAEIGKEIAEEAKQKAKKAQQRAKKEKKPAVSSDEVLSAISESSVECVVRRGGKDLRLSFNGKCVGLLYVGARSFTAYFNSESVKSVLEDAGYEVLTSEEKFNYYSRIDSAILSEVLVNIVND